MNSAPTGGNTTTSTSTTQDNDTDGDNNDESSVLGMHCIYLKKL